MKQYLTTTTAFPSLGGPKRDAVKNLVSSSISIICLMEGCSTLKNARRLGHSQIMMLPDSAARICLNPLENLMNEFLLMKINNLPAILRD